VIELHSMQASSVWTTVRRALMLAVLIGPVQVPPYSPQHSQCGRVSPCMHALNWTDSWAAALGPYMCNACCMCRSGCAVYWRSSLPISAGQL